ncbi:unnamed protein product [Paramecium octaurelia]|uniref:Transmembrane protein n=1 Tax=Paramecium octaurelia TaxID=43137 RepID=A0A8S1VZ52_PAROT|nr:unnamed protein product [Paramecium octaurelia]
MQYTPLKQQTKFLFQTWITFLIGLWGVQQNLKIPLIIWRMKMICILCITQVKFALIMILQSIRKYHRIQDFKQTQYIYTHIYQNDNFQGLRRVFQRELVRNTKGYGKGGLYQRIYRIHSIQIQPPFFIIIDHQAMNLVYFRFIFISSSCFSARCKVNVYSQEKNMSVLYPRSLRKEDSDRDSIMIFILETCIDLRCCNEDFSYPCHRFQELIR